MKTQLRLALIAALTLVGCRTAQFLPGGEQDGISVDYRWNHRPEKPSELLVKISNTGPSAKRVHVGLDLYYQGLTVEEFMADTCIKAGRTLNGKVNGFYFIPQTLDAEQLASPDTQVQLTTLRVEEVDHCP